MSSKVSIRSKYEKIPDHQKPIVILLVSFACLLFAIILFEGCHALVIHSKMLILNGITAQLGMIG